MKVSEVIEGFLEIISARSGILRIIYIVSIFGIVGDGVAGVVSGAWASSFFTINIGVFWLIVGCAFLALDYEYWRLAFGKRDDEQTELTDEERWE